ncbi:MAG TPA: DNA ligase D [Caldimonas sp.]|jgi:bifunctional non-homologous end joining protein LigD|nr:DNA ligase D [Caldimonas sp.]HEX4235152.1 DNA ligase D [Caldimonas sp.]
MAQPPLSIYRQKRNFDLTSEPAGEAAAAPGSDHLSFVVQKHWASRLHYDFRLELDGVLVSWAVPKGPSFDPSKMQMAIHVEDHPLDYAGFEGTIPPRQYGAGTVIVWDRGTWAPEGDPRDGMAKGKLVFRLHGEKLAGLWELVRIAKPGDKQDAWMLFKKKDAWARPIAEYDVITALPDSVVARPLGLIEEREPRAGDAAGADAGAAADAADAPDLSAAVRAPLPAKLEPQLATLVAVAPAGDWIVETKFDGYRLMARIEHGNARLVTRGGHDWTDKMKPLAAAVESLGIASAWLDGEIVVMGEGGLPEFNALQNAIDNAASETIEYFVFDLPFHDGKDLRKVPLRARRALLASLLAKTGGDRVRLSQAFPASPAQMLEAARQMQLEGIIVKRPGAPYVSQRSDSWLKLKCAQRQEFVVCGFTERAGASGEVGSLFLGTYEGGELTYAGNVGTGWDARSARDLHRRLVALETKTPTLSIASIAPGRWSRRVAGGERWARPELVAEVSFREWTADGHVRHGVFVGLRPDKPAREVTRELAAAPAAGSAVHPAAPASSVKVTNPERVIDPSTGITKVTLVRYYESIAERILPHLKDRPVSLVRAPEGITGELFFQKHPETRLPGLRELDRKLWPGHSALLAVDTPDALVSAAQMNTIEFHTWNSTAKKIDQPDRIVFDLDPGEGVTWAQVQEAALLTRAMLTELGLASWLKTSGGKGLHVVVPIVPRLGYDVVKEFSAAVVTHLAKTIPQRFVAKSGGSNRIGRIFVDYLRNGHGQTTATAFSARSRPGLGVSMPVAWEQLMALKGAAQWTVLTAREYLSFEANDPWAEYWTTRQNLAAGMKTLGFKASASRNGAG